MTRWVDRILRRYGQEATVERDGAAEAVRAFLQPVRERDESVPETTAVGWLDGRLWLYLGKAAVRAGDTVLWNGRRFRVRSGRPHYIGTELSHWRAVLERAREAE
ncbi:hypothetical protein [uncultured Oscillibacter sp.]|uniref:hypothetical protein n=1 Tax=uncultured Oscillibacter sp. TaxID=876091 RepID=UPI00261306F6|nr:hypothetical protein [uncultured Oscillibacter sp.]